MVFCLDDGAELLYGPASLDGPATAILHEFGVAPSGGRSLNERTQLWGIFSLRSIRCTTLFVTTRGMRSFLPAPGLLLEVL